MDINVDVHRRFVKNHPCRHNKSADVYTVVELTAHSTNEQKVVADKLLATRTTGNTRILLQEHTNYSCTTYAERKIKF
jgi:hypothetical protein